MIHHKMAVCEGCGKTLQKRKIIWFCGHYLCGSCKTRKNMPLVGYKNQMVWEFEKKVLAKKRREKWFSYSEWTFLKKKYLKQGFWNYREKINALRKRIQVQNV